MWALLWLLQVDDWLAQLDDDEFAVREKATAALDDLWDDSNVRLRLQKALETAGPEPADRIRMLLQREDRFRVFSDWLAQDKRSVLRRPPNLPRNGLERITRDPVRSAYDRAAALAILGSNLDCKAIEEKLVTEVPGRYATARKYIDALPDFESKDLSILAFHALARRQPLALLAVGRTNDPMALVILLAAGIQAAGMFGEAGFEALRHWAAKRPEYRKQLADWISKQEPSFRRTRAVAALYFAGHANAAEALASELDKLPEPIFTRFDLRTMLEMVQQQPSPHLVEPLLRFLRTHGQWVSDTSKAIQACGGKIDKETYWDLLVRDKDSISTALCLHESLELSDVGRMADLLQPRFWNLGGFIGRICLFEWCAISLHSKEIRDALWRIALKHPSEFHRECALDALKRMSVPEDAEKLDRAIDTDSDKVAMKAFEIHMSRARSPDKYLLEQLDREPRRRIAGLVIFNHPVGLIRWREICESTMRAAESSEDPSVVRELMWAVTRMVDPSCFQKRILRTRQERREYQGFIERIRQKWPEDGVQWALECSEGIAERQEEQNRLRLSEWISNPAELAKYLFEVATGR